LGRGDPVTEVFFVREGIVRIYQLDSHGHEITLYRVTGGQACPLIMLAALAGSAYSAWAVVESEGAALSIPVRDFQVHTRNSEALLDWVIASLQQRVLGLLTLLSEVAFDPMDSRIAAFLLALARAGLEATAALSITHEAIAAELGTAREVVSRRLKAFERDGGLRLERGHILLDEGSLPFLRRKIRKPAAP
jgi:CRP/FNR family transcriptional regulator